MKKILLSLGLCAFLATPVFANEDDTGMSEGHDSTASSEVAAPHAKMAQKKSKKVAKKMAKKAKHKAAEEAQDNAAEQEAAE